MFTEDLSVFFNDAEHAVEALIDGIYPVAGIFDEPYGAAGMGNGVATSSPTFQLPTDEVPAQPIDRQILVNDVVYLIRGQEPDGTGVTTLVLEHAS